MGGRSGTDQSDSVPGPGLDQRVVIFPRLPPPSSHSMQSLDPKEDPPPTPANPSSPWLQGRGASPDSIQASSGALRPLLPSPSRAAHSFPRPVPARSLSVAPALAGSDHRFASGSESRTALLGGSLWHHGPSSQKSILARHTPPRVVAGITALPRSPQPSAATDP